MSLNNLKKMIIFSDLTTKNLIEKLVSTEASLEKRSASSVIESRLLDSFLPRERNARCWAQYYLFDDNKGVGKVLDAVFAFNAAGINWGSKYDNLLPLVEFASNQSSLSNETPTGREQELYHCCSNLDSVVKKLHHLSTKANDSLIQQYYEKESQMAECYLNQLKSEPQCVRYANIFQLLLNNWEDLKGWSITYRLLSDLAVLEKGWENTAEVQMELLKILNDVSQEWMC